MSRPDLYIDLRGLLCPLPLLRTRASLKTLMPGQVLWVQVSDEAAIADLKALCVHRKDKWLGSRLIDSGGWDVLIERCVEL
jgi:TusA-related sulfurtransferase